VIYIAADSVGQIGLDLVVNKNDFIKQMSGIQGLAKKAGAALAGAFAIKKLVDFSKSCIELGSDLSEVQNVVDVTFPHMNQQINQFAQNAAKRFGLSETMAKRFTGTFGAMAKAFGFGEKAAYDMSTTLTGLAGDVASFRNIGQDEAYTKLKSVFTGETESLKDLGIVMTQAALDAYALQNGFGKTTAKMSEMEKVALRYKFVQDKLTTAAGDFSRTSDGWANQVKILQLQFDSLKATIGQGLINVLSPVIHVVNTLIGKLMSLVNAFHAFTELVMGKRSGGGASAAAAGMEAVAKAADKAGTAAGGAGSAAKKAAKDMKGISTGIDELNIINPSDNAGSSGSDSAGSGGYDVDDFDMGSLSQGEDVVSEKLKGILDLMNQLKSSFVAGFWDAFGDTTVFDSIQNSIRSIKDRIKEIATDPEVQNAALKFADRVMYALGQISGSVASIGATIADNLLGGIDLYLQQNVSRIKEYIISMFDIGSELWQITGEFSSAIADIFSVFRSDSAKQITADIIGIFSSSFMGVTKLGSKFVRDLIQVITKPITDNAGQIKERIQGLLDELQPIFDKLKELIDKIWDGLNIAYDTVAKPVFDAFKEAISSVVDWITETQTRFDGAIGVVAAFFGAWEVVKLGEFIINAGGVVSMLSGMVAGFVANAAAIATHTAALIADKLETAAIVAMYAKDFVVNLAQGTAALVQQAAQFVINTAAKIADTAAQIAMTAATVAWNAVCAIATTVTTALGAAIAFLTSPIGFVIIAITALITAGVLLYQHWDEVKKFAAEAWEAIKKTINNAIDAVKVFISSTLELIKTAWETKWNQIKAFASNLWNAIKALATSIFEAIRDKLSEIWDSVKRTIEEKWNSIKDWFEDIWKKIKEVFKPDAMIEVGKSIMNKLWDGLKSVWSDITGWLEGIVDVISNTFKKVTDGAKNLFKKAKKDAEDDGDSDEDDSGYVNSGPGAVKGHASGGFPKSGQMFVANEDGNPELVGSWGGRAAVANNHQITQGISQAVQNGMRSCMAPIVSQMASIAQNAAPPLTTAGTGRSYSPDGQWLQSMAERAMSLDTVNMSDQYLAMMVDLLKQIIDLIENLDLTVNIDIREIKKKLTDLEKRSGYTLRTT
jgi:phage-related protein